MKGKRLNKNITASSRVKANPLRDEFYTTEETADIFIKCLPDGILDGKTIYCNCDGPESEIYKQLKKQYKQLGLKRLVATKYIQEGNGIRTDYDGERETVSQLAGDGSYDSPECRNILSSSDVVITNPPFSRLPDFISYIIEAGKDFHIIGNLVSMLRKACRKYVEQGKIYGKQIFPGNGSFLAPDGRLARVNTYVLSTIVKFRHACCLKSFEELEKSGRINYEDESGTPEAQYLRHIPSDYYGPIYTSMTALFSASIREEFDILGISTKCRVNGKNRFYRVLIQKRMPDRRAEA